MKTEVSPAIVVAVIAVVAIIAGCIYWFTWNKQEVSKPPVASGPIQLPASQVGTRLGNQRLGQTYPGTAAPAQTTLPAPSGK